MLYVVEEGDFWWLLFLGLVDVLDGVGELVRLLMFLRLRC